MSAMKEKLSQSSDAYAAALVELNKARSTFENDHANTFGILKKNISDLIARIGENKDAIAATVENFQKEVRASNGIITAAVKAILSDRRSREDVIEECQTILQEVEVQKEALQLTLSPAAELYEVNYDRACHAWVNLKIRKMLADCEEQINEICALPDPRRSKKADLNTTVIPETAPKKLLLKALTEMLANHEVSPNAYPTEIGVFDLGPVSANEVLTIGGRHFARARAKQ